MSDDETIAGLWAAVASDPDSDKPRLVFADYLSERGDPRGEFINVQVRLAGRVNASRRRELASREAELLREHGEKWLATSGTKLKVTLRRGFVDSIRGSAAELAAAQSLLADKTVRIVKVKGGNTDHFNALLAAGLIGRLRSFAFTQGQLASTAAEALAESEQLASLENLNLSGHSIGDDGLRALAESRHFQLRSLTLNGTGASDAGVQALAAAAAAKSLEALYLARNSIGDAGLAAIAGSPHLTKLRQLGLSGNEDITDDGLDCLADPKLAARFEKLELGQIGFERNPVLTKMWGARLDLEW